MIRALLEPAVLTLDVEGRATMLESAAVLETASEQIAGGVLALRIDLRDCTTMDSTFLGAMLSLKRQLDAVGGELTLVSPSPKVIVLLRQMGLDDFYVFDVADRARGAWREVLAPHPEVETLRRVVLDSHDELARIPGPASDAFREVVEELRRNEAHPPNGSNL